MTVEANSKWSDLLVGLTFERLELTSGSADFTFEGDRNGAPAALKAGTPFEICCSTDALFKRDISDDPAELAALYDCLGRQVFSVCLADDGRKLSITLSDNRAILIWSVDAPSDNLVTVRDLKSDEWGVIG